MARFDDDDDDLGDDDAAGSRHSKGVRNGNVRRDHRNTSAGAGRVQGRSNSPVSSSGDVTGKALLAAGCVLALGIGAMVAVRMSTIPEVRETSESVTSGTDLPTASEPDPAGNEPEEDIVIPDISSPDDSTSTPSKRPVRKRQKSAAGTDVASPNGPDTASNNDAGTPPLVVPDAADAIKLISPDYTQPNPWAGLATVNVVGKERAGKSLVQIQNIALHVVRLSEDTRGAVTAAIASGVQAGLERCQLQVSQKPSEPVMLIELSLLQNKMLMTASLICKDQSDYLLLWQKSAQLGMITDQALQQGILSANLTRDADTFFAELRSILVDLRRETKAP